MSKTSVVWKLSSKEFRSIFNEAQSVRHALRLAGLCPSGKNSETLRKRCLDEGLDYEELAGRGKSLSEIRARIPTEEILVEHSTYSSSNHLRQRLIKEGILVNECLVCGVGSLWQNQELTLQLDHINGCNSDNRIENLRLLCPNCHSQTKTYAGKSSQKNKPQCSKCGSSIHSQSKTGICRSCSQVGKRRKVERPSKEALAKLIQESTWVEIGKKFGVSDNAVRKWAKQYDLI